MMKLLVVAGFLMAVSAQAAPATWTLSNVIFLDGSSASGSFTYNENTNAFSDISIITRSSPSVGETKNEWGSMYTSSYPESTSRVLHLESGRFSLSLQFESDLANTGGTILLAPGMGRFGSQEKEGLFFEDEVRSRDLASGSVIGVAAVPIPAAVWLFGSALGGLGWLRRKQTV